MTTEQESWKRDLAEQFGSKEVLDDLADAEVLYEGHADEAYEDSILVLYRKGGKLYDVEGSHCSCCGFEDCWSPSEISIGALEMKQPYLSKPALKELAETIARLKRETEKIP